ncbi:exosortase A [Rheinheimera pacifica]|uniref:exosortase A n=1 Tax=Rheinheimera pacifica TaxID=173990 RepID=UPI00216A8490|nr:exosortase A [Rheinheimera pacifica]MCS4307447.1 exosortase A [Rheinheimera pacifica]
MTPLNRQLNILFVAVIGLAYVVLYSSTWLDMERVWRSSATYNHCYLILPICLYFFYRAKTPLITPSVPGSWLWLPALGLILLQLIWLFGYAADIALLMHIAAVMSLQALLWLVLGSTNSRLHWFAITYLIFLVPFGEELSPFLQNITADLTVVMLQTVSIPVYREGLYLATPVGLFEVAEACSGLRFLIASLAISALFAYLHYNKIWKQISFVVFMALLSVLANGVRAFMLVYIGEKTDMRFGFGADHYLYGWIFFGLVLMAGFWLGAKFSDPVQKLERRSKQHFSLQTKPAMLILATAIVAMTLSYRLSLNVITESATVENLAMPLTSEPVEKSNWGINFVDSLAQSHTQDTAGTEYFAARYGNKQQNGELINWQNNLFDKQRWQIQKRITGTDSAILQLRSLTNEQRTVLYWYQIDEQRVVPELEVKVRQALSYLADDQSTAYIFAVSVNGKASEQNLAVLQQAAALLSQTHTGTDQAVDGDQDD